VIGAGAAPTPATRRGSDTGYPASWEVTRAQPGAPGILGGGAEAGKQTARDLAKLLK
jgi:hypothetical protein